MSCVLTGSGDDVDKLPECWIYECRIAQALNDIALDGCAESIVDNCRIIDTVQSGVLATGQIRELVIRELYTKNNQFR